jgi:colanic acid biosynthesis glycosyl transferase WcaI
MRVLILSQYYAPEPIPKPVELAESLVARGHEVTVVTGFPNYPSGDLYPGYRLGLMRREVIGGVPVIRTFEYPYHGLNAIGRAANYLSFAASAPLAAAVVKRVDVIYVWHPPLTVGLPAWMLGWMCRAPFVYDVQDIWPDAAVDAGAFQRGPLTRALHVLERFVYRRAAHIITATEPARGNLLSKGVPANKVTTLPHWIDTDGLPDATTLRDGTRRSLGWSDRFIVLFAGNLGVLQGLDAVVTAARAFTSDERFRIVFVGDGSERNRLEALSRDLGVADRVEFLARRPPGEMPALFAAADALLIHLKQSRLAEWTVPTKTLAYLAAGRPIIVAAGGPSAALVRDAEAGLEAPPDSPEALASVIRAMAATSAAGREAMGRAGRAYVDAHLTRRHVLPRYEQLLQAASGLRTGR